MSACRGFESLLEGWLAGTLDGPSRRAAEAHLTACPACRELAALARLPEDAPNLSDAILAATTGPACARAEERLPAHLDADGDGTDHRLVALHLESCPACRALAATLVAMDAVLPNLGELTPPRRFTARVLARTLPSDVRLRRWLRGFWPRLVQRPRFATELAYALTVAGVLTVRATSAFSGTETGVLLDRARAGSAEQVRALSGAPAVTGTAATARRLGDGFSGFFASATETAGTFLHATASSLQNPDEADSSTLTEETP